MGVKGKGALIIRITKQHTILLFPDRKTMDGQKCYQFVPFFLKRKLLEGGISLVSPHQGEGLGHHSSQRGSVAAGLPAGPTPWSGSRACCPVLAQQTTRRKKSSKALPLELITPAMVSFKVP